MRYLEIGTYEHVDDICLACGKRGGSHYSHIMRNGKRVSWCHSGSKREGKTPFTHPHYFTAFTYSKDDSPQQTQATNPNEGFKRRKEWEKI
jgi:hypothetical protein